MVPKTIIDRFSRIAESFANEDAVRFFRGGNWESVSYADLQKDAKSVAASLREHGHRSGDPVVLPSLRHPDLLSHVLGTLWAGGYYVFLDGEYPPERQQFICEEVGASIALRPEGFDPDPALGLQWLSPVRDSAVGTDVDAPKDPEAAAYVMFTSGSTGEPKGVIVPHRAIHRLVVDADFISFGAEETFLQLSALSFDASTLEIWGPLLNGGTCVLHPEVENISPGAIGKTIRSQGVTTAWITSSLFNALVSEHVDVLAPLKQLLTGGEALSVPHVARGLEQLPATRIYNGYGPTENTTFTTVHPIARPLPAGLPSIPIGRAIHGTTCELFDEDLNPVSGTGVEGELIAFGDGLALGYLGRPELTEARFIDVRCTDGVVRRGYRTGDIVKTNDDGDFVFVGRNDQQVKIDGHRIEPGEIEAFLNAQDAVSEARVVVKVGPRGQKRLAAYFVPNRPVEVADLRSAMADHFPHFMVPHFVLKLEALPKNKNGKLDEAALPDPFASGVRTEGSRSTVANCWEEILGRRVSADLNFLDAGGTSLEALGLTDRLSNVFGRSLSPTFVFEYPTIASQARHLEGDAKSEARSAAASEASVGRPDVAIVGMACRFPGAKDVQEFWDNLLNARESISFFSDEELSCDVDPEERSNPNYVRAKGIIDDVDRFDAQFFGISPIEAKIMDPQQRLMLELSWHALEDANVPPGDEDARTGVFMGMNWARYYQQYVLPNTDLVRKFGKMNSGLANETDLLSTRVSYKLNLKGPSLNVFTACSTGLVAVAQACEAIQQGQCEQALAGGISVIVPAKSGYVYQEGSMLSNDGHCRPFDVNARGTTFNDGAGVVVLKRLDLAERDGDRIYSVIKGFAVNNDGERKASFTAPSVGGQVAVYDAALRMAGFEADTVGFIETHGTATPLGDPIEVQSLRKSYADDGRTEKNCAIGSVKSNIGHAIHAAGIAALIKAALAVRDDAIPPTLFFEQPNPKLELERSPFFVNTEVVPFVPESARRAAVSSLGVGGTNAHVLLEEYRPSEAAEGASAEPTVGEAEFLPVLISSKTKDGLARQIESYRAFFERNADATGVADASWTTQTGRTHFDHRTLVCGRTIGDVVEQLSADKQLVRGRVVAQPDSRVGFMFSGQGAQRVEMGRWLLENDDAYRETFERGCRLLRESEGLDLAAVLFPADGDDVDPETVNQTRIAQPALFLMEYGLARFLMARGCRPDFLIGHSIGEFAAAALAGVFSFDDTVRLVGRRGALMQSMPSGKMLAVRSGLGAVEDLIAGEVNLAALNAPEMVVLSGPEEALVDLVSTLEGRSIKSSVLQTSHAFHSHMMEPIVDEFAAFVETLDRHCPSIPIYSTMTGRLLGNDEAASPRYWASQLRQPVRFSDALLAVQSDAPDVGHFFLEVGPGGTLATLASFHDLGSGVAHATLPGFGTAETSYQEIAQALGKLWVHGFEVDFESACRRHAPQRLRLPGYAFADTRFWLDPVTAAPAAPVGLPPSPVPMVQNQSRKVEMSQEAHQAKTKARLQALLEDVTGYDLEDLGDDTPFGEAGLDSLLLTQIATALEREFDVAITFRHLVEEYTCLQDLTEFVAEQLPVETEIVETPAPAAGPQAAMPSSAMAAMPAMPPMTAPAGAGGSLEQIVATQLEIMQWQLQALRGGAPAAAPPAAPAPAPEAASDAASDSAPDSTGSPNGATNGATTAPKASHSPKTRIVKESSGSKLTTAQRDWIVGLLAEYQQKFRSSKAYAQAHRRNLADPRTVSGFNPEWKEIVFPIVTERSKGSKLWDVDGNELIDLSNGFGPIFFGHSPDFVSDAVKEQIDRGIETGPQSPLAGEVADLFCELTGHERCTFACSGSEAVAGAIRVARTVTGRSKVVMFEGAYHGIFDEVISRPGKNHQALPAAPGIPRESTANMVVVPWGEEESLDIIRGLGKDLAAVLVEPVQSRKPEFHSPEYLQALRDVTTEIDAALIFDEVVTGFRVHPGGITRRFDIRPDLASYGKVVGGGYPIGIIGGKAKFMDALDGGHWEFGDDSIPEVGVTFFAGTFVRHPLALAAAKAMLTRIKTEGTSLYDGLDAKTAAMADEARRFTADLECGVRFESFSSIFYVAAPPEAHWNHLLFLLMTLKGLHIQQYRPSFLTTEHDEDDVATILTAFKDSVAELVYRGLMKGNEVKAKKHLEGKNGIPPGARLGKNADGEPAYFIEDPENAGQYIEVGKP